MYGLPVATVPLCLNGDIENVHWWYDIPQVLASYISLYLNEIQFQECITFEPYIIVLVNRQIYIYG